TLTTASLSFWLHIETAEGGATAHDTLKVQITNNSGTVLATLATYSNLDSSSGYVQKSFDISQYKGQAIKVLLTGVEDSARQTSFPVGRFRAERAVADIFRERDAIPDKRPTFRNLDLKDTWQGHVPDCRRGSARSEGASALTKLLPVRRATKKEGDQTHPSSVDDFNYVLQTAFEPTVPIV